MYYFECDYMEGAHPAILERLQRTNLEKTSGYGSDPYCESAKEKIKKACCHETASVHFLVGGTQTNAAVIKTFLRPYQGVLSAETGHVNTHEAGAIEAGGHKVLTLPQTHGKLTAAAVSDYMEAFSQDGNHTHMVYPGMVYLSHPTEYGALYTKAELEALHTVCQRHQLLLYLDGARLGYGLASLDTDVTLQTIADNCDLFYIGGTKVGAFFGEALVITRPELDDHFFTIIKQQGALLAKGRLLGIQFDTLFTDDLYYRISRHAIEMAELLKKGLQEKGYSFYYASPTNQQFLILNQTQMEALSQKVSFSFWETLDEQHTVIRLATSWATTKEEVEGLLAIL